MHGLEGGEVFTHPTSIWEANLSEDWKFYPGKFRTCISVYDRFVTAIDFILQSLDIHCSIG